MGIFGLLREIIRYRTFDLKKIIEAQKKENERLKKAIEEKGKPKK